MPPSKAQRIATSDRRKKALALLIAGMDYETIAERLNYSSRGAASKDICRMLAQHREEEEEKVAEWIQMEVARYDRLQAAVWPKALRGDLKAIETVLKIIAGRAKLRIPEVLRAEVTGANGGPLQFTDATAAELHHLIGLAGDPDQPGDDADGEDTGGDGDPAQG